MKTETLLVNGREFKIDHEVKYNRDTGEYVPYLRIVSLNTFPGKASAKTTLDLLLEGVRNAADT